MTVIRDGDVLHGLRHANRFSAQPQAAPKAAPAPRGGKARFRHWREVCVNGAGDHSLAGWPMYSAPKGVLDNHLPCLALRLPVRLVITWCGTCLMHASYAINVGDQPCNFGDIVVGGIVHQIGVTGRRVSWKLYRGAYRQH